MIQGDDHLGAPGCVPDGAPEKNTCYVIYTDYCSIYIYVYSCTQLSRHDVSIEPNCLKIIMGFFIWTKPRERG